MNAERFRLKSLALACVRRFFAEIDDGGDAKFFQFVKIGKMGLRAAKKRIGNFSGVGNARKRDFLSDCGRERKRNRG